MAYGVERMERKNMSQAKVLGEGKFIRLLSENGWEYIQRVNCQGIAVIIAITEQNELLLVEQYRPAVRNNAIELPAGLIDDGDGKEGESGLEAAKRELMEETGYEAQDWRQIFSGPGGAGASSDILTFYMATNARKVADGGGGPDEKIAVHAVPMEQVVSWLEEQHRSGVPTDPKIYAGLYFVTIYNNSSN